MNRVIFACFVLISGICFSQVPKNYKKLTDTLFNTGDRIITPQMLWTLGKAELMPESKDSLLLVAKWMKKHPCFKIEIGCHTDSRGNPASCQNLSAARAQSIVDYLVKGLNMPPNMLVAKGYGRTQPLFWENEMKNAKTKHETEEFHQRNRRTEIKILWISYKSFNDAIFVPGDKIYPMDIHFSLSGGAQPLPEMKDSLNKIVAFLKLYPGFKIEIGCHTDQRGKAAANMTLSAMRGQSIVDYLVKEKGLPAEKIVAKGYGASEPRVTLGEINCAMTREEKEALHSINRRTEVRILAVQ
jgi:outer membrane protein OmpA-like peptidoglycan-associated protein